MRRAAAIKSSVSINTFNHFFTTSSIQLKISRFLIIVIIFISLSGLKVRVANNFNDLLLMILVLYPSTCVSVETQNNHYYGKLHLHFHLPLSKKPTNPLTNKPRKKLKKKLKIPRGILRLLISEMISRPVDIFRCFHIALLDQRY